MSGDPNTFTADKRYRNVSTILLANWFNMQQILVLSLLVILLPVRSSALVSNGHHRPAALGRQIRPLQALSTHSTQKATRSFQRAATFLHSSSPSSFGDDSVDPAILVSAQDDRTQQLFVLQASLALAVGTAIWIQAWYHLAVPIFGAAFLRNIATVVFPLVFGVIFAAVGVGHFLFCENFSRIVPPKGTWGGLWQLPTPLRNENAFSYEDYFSYLSGLFEVAGGLWLLAGGLGLTASAPLAAWLLFALTVAVSPANLYMYTHNVGPGGAAPTVPYPWGHYARFGLQCGLLSNFWLMANPP